MKLTLSNVKEIKRNSDSPLTKRVCNYVIGRWGDYNDKKYIFTDVLHNGCCSGVVSELIYYYDPRDQRDSLQHHERNGALRSFGTLRRQVGQGRSACTGRFQSKPAGVVRF